MSAPPWTRALLRRLARNDRRDEVLGDLEEAHRRRLQRRGRVAASLLTAFDALDMARVLVVDRVLSGAAVSWLDFKLGFRMLLKYPGLTVVAGGAIAFAIALGVGTFEFITDYFYPRLPLDEADRIVEIENVDVSRGERDAVVLADYVAWRDGLGSVDEIGAFGSFRRTLRTEGEARVLTGAAMTASALAIARVPPLLGRPLLASDEAPGAPSVVVIGHDVWRSLFLGDPDVVGAPARLGSEPVTVVGVMPDGFGWPWAHEVWAPLRVDPAGLEAGLGPRVQVVARIRDGVSLDEAGAELSAIGLRTAAHRPETHERLRQRVVPYGRAEEAALALVAFSATSVFFALLLLLVCGNVGLLLFARTAAREREIVVRSALGASRGRVVMQLFAEALVLGGLAAAVGLYGAHLGLEWVFGMFDRFWAGHGQLLGFWSDATLSGRAIAYALLWTLVAAVVSGVLPALKITGRAVQPRLQRAGAGGSGLEFGRLWTTIIVTQVAVTVAFAPMVILLGAWTARIKSADYGFPAGEYLSLELAMDGDRPSNPAIDRPAVAASERYRSAYTELRRRVVEELGVQDVAVVGELPGAWHTSRGRIEVEGPDGTVARGGVQVARVGAGFFGAIGARMIAGRGLGEADFETGRRAVVVNEDFVDQVLGGRSALGRRFALVSRDAGPQAPREWYDIVGVVAQIAMTIDPERTHGAGVYVPLAPDTRPVRMAMRVGADPLSLAPLLHRLAGEVDPELQLTGLRPLNESAFRLHMTYSAWFWVVMAAGGAGLLLANAGIFSIMSFTVSRRTREIGIRVALGADTRRIVWGVFSRTLKQVGVGVAAGGLVFASIVMWGTELDFPRGVSDVAILFAYLTAMLGLCLLACLVPTRRALAIEPTEALRQR